MGGLGVGNIVKATLYSTEMGKWEDLCNLGTIRRSAYVYEELTVGCREGRFTDDEKEHGMGLAY